MATANTKFWLGLLSLGDDEGHRTRFWNGYLGWKLPPQVKEVNESKEDSQPRIVDPPDGGWPELTKDEKKRFDRLAEHHGGHPEFNFYYMNFSGHSFRNENNLSGLTFVHSHFENAKFRTVQTIFDEARFFGETSFKGAVFEHVQFCYTKFDETVSFASSRFINGVAFKGVDFMDGASFRNAVFERYVNFNDSKFKERYISNFRLDLGLADFRNAKFMDSAYFRNVHFGNNEKIDPGKKWSQRKADFTDAQFGSTTDFTGAVFRGAPAFFNTTFHEETDFSEIDWEKAETDTDSANYSIQAWERLELMMSKLEKPFERHQFFRMKMRARRRIDSWFMRTLNRIFEVTSDYGWGVRRAFFWWFCHWFVMSLLLYLNTGTAAIATDWWKLAKAALGTGFANAHAFLGLATEEGYLAPCKQVLLKNNELGFLTAIGTTQAFLGPIFLFLFLLTLRNRFRLA